LCEAELREKLKDLNGDHPTFFSATQLKNQIGRLIWHWDQSAYSFEECLNNEFPVCFDCKQRFYSKQMIDKNKKYYCADCFNNLYAKDEEENNNY
jgi:predicted SprT family Zn-dependent metalloprotease